MAKWLIDKFEMSGGFLPGFELQFPAGLTCIIGPRGSGKSTLIEAIRFSIFGTKDLPRSRADLVQANLGSAFVTVQTAPDDRGEYLTIRRGHKQAASLTSSTARSMGEIDLERGSFLPLDAYSSAEIESIADENLGQKRRALLDELIGEPLRQIDFDLAEKRRGLESNADAIRATLREIADLNEQIEETGDARGRLDSLPPPAEGDEPTGVSEAAQQQSANAAETEALQAASDGLAKLKTLLTHSLSDLTAPLESPLVVTGSKNASLLQSAEESLRSAGREIAKHSEAQLAALDRANTALQGIRQELEKAHLEQKTAFAQIQQENLAASQAVQRRQAAQKEVESLSSLEEKRGAANSRLGELRTERGQLRAQYLLEVEKVSRMRSEVANQLQSATGGRVRIRVIENADQLDYRQTLTTGLQGARVRNHEDILNVLLRLRPDELAQIVHDNDVSEFENHTSFGQERSATILSAFRSNLDPFSLELTAINDLVRIELNVSTGDSPIFKDAAELSRGQKCTALLPILLARRDVPLLIDQPEDNLDNHFIYETVVDSIRRLKTERQMILITHNANIPVLGEADLVVVMNSDGKQGYVEKAGSLDECREEIIDLLEGGEEAFELRRQRYAKR